METKNHLEGRTLTFTHAGVHDALETKARTYLNELAVQAIKDSSSTGRSENRIDELASIINEICEKHLRPANCKASVEFMRTLRIPDDNKDYPLPPGLGKFPLKHVDDYASTVPREWNQRGGIMLPIYQSEAMWLNFEAAYPCALKVATGKICAITGESWNEQLQQTPQNYCALPQQPWLDGYCVEAGLIRQFVATTGGRGHTAEEQLTGSHTWGGIQLEVYPLDPEIYWKNTLKDKVESAWRKRLRNNTNSMPILQAPTASFSMAIGSVSEDACMGIAPGGRMKQEIYQDERKPEDYVKSQGSRCFVHLCNAVQWTKITGETPPEKPLSASDYSKHGLPWFEYYDENSNAVEGSSKLAGLDSLGNDVNPKVIIKYIKS